jgi:hypothetical protein
LVDLGRRLGGIDAALVQLGRSQPGRIAAELDVRATAGHVRGDGYCRAAAGLGDDRRFLLVELGVEHLVLDAAPIEHLGEHLALLNTGRTDEHRPALVGHLDDLVNEGVELGVLISVNDVGVIGADHRSVGRDGDHLEAVDLVELLLLGHRRAGHAGQLVVQPEVVLEGDGGVRHRLALHAQAFLRLDRLMQTLAPAPAGHLAAGELVDYHDLTVLDDVVAVALVKRMRLERLVEVTCEAWIGGVQVVNLEQLLDLFDTVFSRRDGVLLEVEEVVAALLGAFGSRSEPIGKPGELVVQVLRLFSLAADDQRRARLVDEDVVDLVDDGEITLALSSLGKVRDHVVAQVVEAELVVGAVGDVGRVGLPALDRPQVDQPFVGRPVVGVEYECTVVLDDADR